MSERRFATVDDLSSWLGERNLHGFWNAPRERAEVEPYLWKWEDLYQGLMSAGQLVQINTRTIQPKNPGLTAGMSKTVHFSVHLLNPGERAKGHRNSVIETRFVLQASPGMAFVIDGEPFAVEAGDLVTTPNWSWHDHYNQGAEPAIWLDCMDSELVAVLGRRLDERCPADYQEITKPEGYSAKTLRNSRAAELHDRPTPPPCQYRWADTYETLMTLKETQDDWDPFDGVRVSYANPITGGPTFATNACEMQLLAGGLKTRRHRHNCTTLYHAFRGAGRTEIDGEAYDWSQGDIFVVPPWAWHRHENPFSSDAILFSMTDRPAAAALGLYREEAVPPSPAHRA